MSTQTFGDLVIEVNQDQPGLIRMDWRGKSTHRQPQSVLAPLFAQVTTTAVTTAATVEMHFERLEFFNSSTITVVLQFFRDLRERKVKQIVSFSAKHKWQKLFFDALWVYKKKSDGLFDIVAVD